MTVSPNETFAAVFFDRDGTLMREVNYCGDPKHVEVFSDAASALRKLKEHGYKLIIVTNQSGIGRGFFSEEVYRNVQNELIRQLGEGLIDATYFCPDLPDVNSARRKPSPEMVFEAQRENHLDLSRSFFIGDKAIDVQCGRNAGVRTVLMQTGYGAEETECRPDWIARDLSHAAEIILAHQR